MNDQLWWYVARASGLVGWFLCTLAVVWGLALSTRLLGKRPKPAWLLDLHRFLGGLATTFVVIHVGGLVADSYTHFGVADVLVPLASSWKPGAVAWGIAGFYLLLAVEVTSLARRHLPGRLWRRVHAASLPLWVVSTVHLVTAGTDAGNPLVWWTALLSTAAVLFVTLVRVLSPRSGRSGQRSGPVGAGVHGAVQLVRPHLQAEHRLDIDTDRIHVTSGRSSRPGGQHGVEPV
jgi:predicted ferric reductase